jgi:hypothetical protein
VDALDSGTKLIVATHPGPGIYHHAIRGVYVISLGKVIYCWEYVSFFFLAR